MKKRNIFLLQGVVLYFIFSCFLSAQERPQLKLNPTQSETITVDVNLDLITGENGIALVKFQKVYDVRNGATIDTNIKLTGIPTRYNYYLHRNYTKNNCPPDEIKVSGQCYPEDYGILLCPAHQFCHKAWVIPTEEINQNGRLVKFELWIYGHTSEPQNIHVSGNVTLTKKPPLLIKK